MSTMRELICGCLTDEPQGRAAIAELVGAEAQTVSVELNALQAKGLAQRTGGGWIAKLQDGKTPRTHAAPETETPAPDGLKPRKSRAKAKSAAKVVPKTPTKRAMAAEIAPFPKPPPSAPTSAARECEFAIAESGAVLFKVIAGPRTGELGSINHVDAMALFRLMDACDFIRENA